ncbi:MAG: hypothetical protein PHU42_03180, partial [Patescibacteria group bacterium]|nr:hypothetical protein [Patescibacteria group bacterium]
DRKNPNVPIVYPVTSPTAANSQVISGTKQKCAGVWRGTTQIAPITDALDCNNTDSWSETVNFNSYSTYSFTYFAQDQATNKSANVTVQIQYTNNGGGGGGGGGTCSCGNGVCEQTNDCSGGGGGGTTGNYSLVNTIPIPSGSVDITAYNGNLLVVTYGDGSAEMFDTSGGQTDYTMSGAPAFGTPVSGSACVNATRFVIADQTVNNTGQIDIFTIDTANHELIFASSFGFNNTESDDNVRNPDDVFCDSTGNFWVLDRGNNLVKKFNSSGTLACKYPGATQLGQDIAVDNAGNAYITNQGTDRVDVINSSCALLKVVGTGASTSNPLFNPGALAVSPDGKAMAVDDTGNHRISFFNPSLRTDLGYIGYSTSAAAIKGAAVIGTTFYILRGSTIEVYQSN